MNTFRNLKKNAKALSPVVASIILIAVTVAVSVVVAAWMGGMSIGLMGNAEQSTITNLDIKDDGTISATVQNTGNSPITINAGYINGTVVDDSVFGTAIPAKSSASYLLDAGATAYASGDGVTVKLTTTKGNNLVLDGIKP